MNFIPDFSIGEAVSNDVLRIAFRCGNMGGMRPSRATNTLVIISDHTKGLYEDKWVGDVLHYTGMGKSGDQSLVFMWNKTLNESNKNGVEVHLFEALIPMQYIYCGPVRLCGDPYQENQPGEDGIMRKVWMFPVIPLISPPVLDNTVLEKYTAIMQRKAYHLTDDELEERAQSVKDAKVGQRRVISSAYVRNAYVTEHAKRRANGFCQLCGQRAPFNDKDGQPYLECHHIQWLSQGGHDSIDNTAALCPNCHKMMHILNRISDQELLAAKARKVTA